MFVCLFVVFFFCLFCRSVSISEILHDHRLFVLPIDEDDQVRITVRRKHILGDTFHKLRNGLDVKKHLKVTFIGEPAVDAGGPLREYFHRLLRDLSQDNSLLCGPQNSRVPRHSVVELEKRSFFHVGVILALSLLHGGPAPQFFSSAVADYITVGIEGVKCTLDDVPDLCMRKSLEKVRNYLSRGA